LEILALTGSREVELTATLLDELYALKIFLRYNSPPPKGDIYGWLKVGDILRTSGPIRIEQNVGLYGGAYLPLTGGTPACGLCPIGAFSYSYSPLPEEVTVGRYCSISSGLRFIDSHHPLEAITTSAMMFRPYNHLFAGYLTEELKLYAACFSVNGGKSYPCIGNDVWIGANVTLAMGIKLGTGCVVAANSVVTKDVPPYAIVGGNPASIIKFRFDFPLIAALLRSEWWNFDPRHLFKGDPGQPAQMIAKIERGEVPAFSPLHIDL